jgi:D-aminopeptidase
MEALHHVGGQIWTLPCPRALDHGPPGDWTLSAQLDGALVVGCWLARGLQYHGNHEAAPRQTRVMISWSQFF